VKYLAVPADVIGLIQYRLERIKQLTGLDLARHDDRMRADVALRLLQLNGT
jgi:DNA-binding PucR family transcriptional regulator